jgi:site-specific recombinase XerD
MARSNRRLLTTSCPAGISWCSTGALRHAFATSWLAEGGDWHPGEVLRQATLCDGDI